MQLKWQFSVWNANIPQFDQNGTLCLLPSGVPCFLLLIVGVLLSRPNASQQPDYKCSNPGFCQSQFSITEWWMPNSNVASVGCESGFSVILRWGILRTSTQQKGVFSQTDGVWESEMLRAFQNEILPKHGNLKLSVLSIVWGQRNENGGIIS